ncbi:MAG: cysteine--tRNA ligase [Candidatus Marinimicrobia bacterium]|jgi:cysteinyl-tRNA synthetase|nr:cysteine--tRNA ligase [Candidatus Neomarinimicrobiota bacterium]MBT3847821.1 cysteine--tRNA ligase [Candidatus Neomarinimicrobiota bacterium]MBT4055251.1 cysteine--tRNA ligase [Candidatus Neomarinimicrobiota bacterium]MBT4369627.1 cysteine--tRNA ligase [Candidatus Neomarinimicrobiota bacterium]MBT4661624.1 cysteine--tRNA ligase [Candidatus Neomarinimicrobiota bacterium]
MPLQFYNTLKREKEIFQPIEKGKVGLYTCGPTVYDYAHIGNFRTFMFEDLLKRWLLHLRYDVKHVMNITDVDDKTIKKAKQMKVSLSRITDKYTQYFMEDLKWLKMIPADIYPTATESIPKMISMIERLLEKGFAYREDDGSVYFNISSFPNYGRLTQINISEQRTGDRVMEDEYDKDVPQDFALWKGWKEEDGEVVWDAPWGRGRPGWHIECSAMSSESLGDNFDIHCGGVDNMFPHHENEIAQSQCATDQPFVNFWLHSEFLMLDGGKMSKSLGNYYRISALKELGFTAESIRYQLLAGHYRSKITFSIDKKHEGDKVVQRLSDFYTRLQKMNANESSIGSMPEAYSKFRDRMNDDLDSPQALAVFFDWMKTVNGKIDKNVITDSELGEAWEFLVAFDSVFGFIQNQDFEIPNKINLLLKKRQKARDEDNWVESDLIREQLKEKGWIVDDTTDGQNLKKV